MRRARLVPLLTALITSLLVPARPAAAIETELFGVRLGARYAETKAALTKKYGAPFQSVTEEGQTHDAFQVDPKSDTVLTILTRPAVAKYVGAIQLSGTHVLPDFNFIGALNLGFDELAVRIGYPLPVSVGKVTDGYVHYELPDSNLSIETKEGRVASLLITSQSPASSVEDLKTNTMVVMSTNQSRTMLEAGADKFPGVQPLPEAESDALMAHATTDPLRPLCEYRHPIRWNGVVFEIDLNVLNPAQFKSAGPSGLGETLHRAKGARFLLDTGYRFTTLTTPFCRKIGCKVIRAPRGSDDGLGTGGTVLIGTKAASLDNFHISDVNVAEQGDIHFDGILGRDVLLARPLLLNLRDEYVCFPKAGVADAAKTLGLTPLALPATDPITLPATVNGKPVAQVFLDTGSDTTSFVTKDIKALGLTPVTKGPKIRESHTVTGRTRMKLYGPARVEISAATRKFGRTLDAVAEAPDIGLQKVGNDILHGMIVGLDAQAKQLFIGD